MFNTGIYQIVNLTNDKRYIGSAFELKRRKNDHFCLLKKNKHPNVYLQRSYNKNGKEIFKFEILLYCSKDDLLFYEQRTIDCYDFKKELYNICLSAGNTSGVSIYDIWVGKYGKEIADKKWEIKNKRTSQSFKNKKGKEREDWINKTKRLKEENGHYGKTTFDIHLEKYGKEEAEKRRTEWINKKRETMNRWDENKKKNYIEKLKKAHEKVDKKEKDRKYKETVKNRTKEREKEIFLNRSNACSGSKNGRAKHFLFIDPNGNKFNIIGRFEKFCSSNKINSNKMREVSKGLLDSYKNWKCIEVENK